MLFTFILGLFFLAAPPGQKVKSPKIDTHEALYQVIRWMDTAFESDKRQGVPYNRGMEERHMRDKGVIYEGIFPTYFQSPFNPGDWCQAIKKEEPDFLSEG